MVLATGVDYEVETYTTQQHDPVFRHEFLATLGRLEQIRWPLAPSHGQVHLRLPCPECGWAEKSAERTKLVRAGSGGADFAAVCTDHGPYGVAVTADTGAYPDLATLYRNLVKERMAMRDPVTLSVMVKGGDSAYGCQLVDEAFALLPDLAPPPRIFTPMVLTDTGAKLSKSLIRDGKVPPPPGGYATDEVAHAPEPFDARHHWSGSSRSTWSTSLPALGALEEVERGRRDTVVLSDR
ncbi:hypothetical protein ACTMTI_53350 [Nonomuraea sp. H19]